MTLRLSTFILIFHSVPWVANATHHGIEELFGATNIHAAFGNGVISAAWSDRGELTVLRWPNPTFHEHMHYRTEGGEGGYLLPHMGAADNDGGFDGAIVGTDSEIWWFREAPWLTTVTYADDDVDVLVREHSWGARKVTCEELADGSLPVLRRRCTLEGDGVHTYVGYLNPALMTEHKAFEPTIQAFDDDTREAALRWDAGLSAFVDVADGVVLVVGVDPAPEQVHCGRDNGTGPGDAFTQIKGSTEVVGPENLAFRVPATQVETILCFGATEAQALAQLEAARSVSFDEARAERESTDRAWLAGAQLPDIVEAEHAAFVDRTLLSLRSGRDPESGAIVASLSSQPPYNLDWPRDGAFFNMLLQQIGFEDLVDEHNAFYAQVQRTEAGQDAAFNPELAAPGSWAMNYYSDGVVGGFIDFEIDQVGLVLWTMSEHSAEDRWEAIELAAGLLVECKDEETGLQCPANEDDNPSLSQTLHGASAVWMGLDAAVRAAKRLGKAGWEPWDERRAELEAAIRERWVLDDSVATENWGALSWLIWPGGFELSDAAKADVVTKLLDQLQTNILLEASAGSAYDAKLTLALAWLLPEDGPERDQLLDVVDTLAVVVPTQGTRHLGEVYIPNGNGTWTNHTAMPHIWEATLTSLTILLIADHPDAPVPPDPDLEPDESPDVAEPAPPVASDDDGCSAGQGGVPPGWLLVLLPLLIAASGRRESA